MLVIKVMDVLVEIMGGALKSYLRYTMLRVMLLFWSPGFLGSK